VQAGLLNSRVNVLDVVRLDRDNHDPNLFVWRATDELVIPDDFVNGERDVLLRFKSNDPVDFLFIDQGQLDKTQESGLRSDRIVDGAALDV
jgi:hypothetical protein